MYKLSMYYAMIKKHRTKGPMPVKDILKEVKKKRLMHNAAWDIDESGIEASREAENTNVTHKSNTVYRLSNRTPNTDKTIITT